MYSLIILPNKELNDLCPFEVRRNKLNSNRKQLILNDGKLFNPFKNEYYDLHITSDLMYIKKDDIYYNSTIKDVFKAIYNDQYLENECKVAATTNDSLNLPKISKQFIENYIIEYNKN